MHRSPSARQAAPFLVFAILALLVSAHAGCTGGLLEEPGNTPKNGAPNNNPNPGSSGSNGGDDYYYGYDDYYQYG